MTKRIIYLLIIFIGMVECSPGKVDHQSGRKQQYTCSMHPQVLQDVPGTCPICGMELVKKTDSNNDDAIMLSESQIRLANILTSPARMERIGESVVLNGKLAANEDQTRMISARVSGRVEKLFFKETGRRIRAGVPLFEIYSEAMLTFQQEYLLALRQAEELKESRYQSFVKSAEKKLLLLGMTREQVSGLARERKADAHIVFLSPASGVISRIDVLEGQYVSEGSSLYRIEQLDELWIEAELYGQEIPLAKIGKEVSILVTGFEGQPQAGKIVFVNPEYRKGTQVLSVRAVMSNHDGNFMPGMQAGMLLTYSEKSAIAVPTDAVIRDGKGSVVWVQDKDGAFRPRSVATGLENFEKIELTSGVKENESIVISGAYLLTGEFVLKRGRDPLTHHH